MLKKCNPEKDKINAIRSRQKVGATLAVCPAGGEEKNAMKEDQAVRPVLATFLSVSGHIAVESNV